MHNLHNMFGRNTCFYCLYCNYEPSLYCLCSGIYLQHSYQCSHLYGLYRLCSRNPRFHRMYNNCKQSMYLLYSRFYLQHDHERSYLHNLCSSLCCRIHLSIYSLYRIHKSYLYSV